MSCFGRVTVHGGVLVRSMAWREDVSEPTDATERSEPRDGPLPKRLTDAELVALALAGDRLAEEAIFCRYVNEVIALALRMLGNRSEAEDVAQDTFLAVLGELSALRDHSALGGWIRRVAVRKVHRRFRRRRMLRALGMYHREPDLPLDALVSEELGPDVRVEVRKLADGLEALPSGLRVAWLLRNIEGYSLQEAADATECSIATVKRRISHATERLRRYVELSKMEEEDG